MGHVEFLGAPGSGKSTLASALITDVPGTIGLEEAVRGEIKARSADPIARVAARLPGSTEGRVWKGVYARSADRLSALNRFLAAHPAALEAVLAGQRERAGRDLGQEQVLGWVLNLMARFQLATESPGSDLLVVDEGFGQRAAAVFGYGFSPEDHDNLARYLKAIPRPLSLIVVETPLETCITRLESRGWSERVAGLDEAQRIAFLRSSNFAITAVTDHLEELGIQVLRVDGTVPTQVGIEAIRDQIDL